MSSEGDALKRLALFGRVLRDAGLPIGSSQIIDFCGATAALPPSDLYWAGRLTLVASRKDIPIFDRLFKQFFGPDRKPPPQTETSARDEAPSPAALPQESMNDGTMPDVPPPSASERLNTRRFADCTAEELQKLAGIWTQLPAPMRRSRSYRPARRGVPDMRRTMRAALRKSGDPIELACRRRRWVLRRVVLLLDVSASMAEYSRAMLFFAHAAIRARRPWETFCFATRLTRITRALGVNHPDLALARSAAIVADWQGGTLIGASLKTFLDLHGHRGGARDAVVIICSDGLESGEPELLRQQMARLSLLAHRIVWINPLKEDPEYKPLARGMFAALPYINIFSSGHNLKSIEEISSALKML